VILQERSVKASYMETPVNVSPLSFMNVFILFFQSKTLSNAR
jgi:hypothetical protein